MRGKIKRIFFRTTGTLLLLLLLIAVTLIFAARSFSFQTWLAQKAGAYLSSELNTTVSVGKIKLQFFKSALLQDVLILDQHRDTLLAGDLVVKLKSFSYKERRLDIEELGLENVTAKMIRYKGDSAFNYSFLVDYFSAAEEDTSASRWDVRLRNIDLNNVAFVYRKEQFVAPPSKNINFDDIYLTGTSGKIRNIHLGDTVTAEISGLTTHEKSGFSLSSLDTRLGVSATHLFCGGLRLKTPRTLVKGYVSFTHESWDDYPDFMTKVKMDSRLLDSTCVSFSDIAAFTSELNGLDESLCLAGHVKGYVSDMLVKDLRLSYGRHTRFEGDLSLTGLPDIRSSFMHFDAKKVSSNYTDLINIPSYPFHEQKKLELPPELQRLGTVIYKGKFDGFFTDFTTYGRFTTALGNIKSRLSIRLGETTDQMRYSGEIQTEDFNLGTLLGQNDLNHITLTTKIKGTGVSVRKIDAEMVGSVSSISFNGYRYKDLQVDATFRNRIFSGLLKSRDPNANFDFNGTADFTHKLPELDFIATINSLRLKELNFTDKADSGVFSSQVLFDITGDNIDNLSGQVHFDDTRYVTKTRKYKLSTFNIVMDQSGEDKRVNLNSDYLTAVIRGNYALSNLKPAFEQTLYNYYPTFFKKPASTKKFSDELVFKVTVKKFNTINELFLPELMVSPGTSAEGNFDAAENKLNLQLSSAKFSYGAVRAHELLFILNENQNTVLAEVSGRALHVTDSIALRNFNLAVRSEDKDSRYTLDWDDLRQPVNKGEIRGQVIFENSVMRVVNEKLQFTVRDSTWQQRGIAGIEIDKAGTLKFDSLFISSRNQLLRLSGRLSSSPADSLFVVAENLRLAQFNPILQLYKLTLSGTMNGRVKMSRNQDNFTFLGDLNVSQMVLNDNAIGDLVVKAGYEAGSRSITMEGFTSLGLADEAGVAARNIAFKGAYYLDKKEESLDLSFSAKPANVKLLNPLLEGILTIRHGFVNGEGRIHGTPSAILIDGKLRLFNSEVKVGYTNVSYNVTGDIEIMPDQIRFSDMLVREKGSRSAPQGTVNGNIFHNNFSRIRIDYDINYNNMLVLNTTEKENSTFYGRLYGTGQMNVYGYLNNISMTVDNTTEKRSRFVLPLDGPAEIGENDFIHFVKRDTVRTKRQKTLTGFNLEMKIHATPDAEAQIILDKQHGDMLSAQGHGDLILTINTFGKFEMFGDYFISNGDYLFTLENVINKKFDIDAGSSISWSGNPMNAEINIITSYKQRVVISPLLNDTSGQYKGRFPVDCKLLISGKLFSPDIRFVIDFPTLEATPRARIANVLSDEAELNRQVFSFLLFRTFLTPQIYNLHGGGVTASSAAASTGSEMLSNRVSEFLNTYLGNVTGLSDLQLGLNYRAGSQNANDAVDVALSKQFLNNKITVDGNFGVNNNPQNRNSSGLIGDVNIDYKLSDDGRYRLKGFNRSNDNAQITTAGGPYTQGIGFFYREEFETFSQLLKRYLKKDRKK